MGKISIGSVVYYVRRQPLELLVLPGVNLVLAVIFWASQLSRYHQSVRGVLYSWIILGVLFVFVQLSLFPGAWRESASHSPENCFGARWLLGSQIIFCTGVILYTIATLAAMAVQRAQLVPYDGLNVAAASVVLVPALITYRKRLADPQAKLAYATACKVAPQYGQAAALLSFGVRGVSPVSLGALISIVGLRFLIARATHRKGANHYTQATLTAAHRDWWSVLVMAICWGVGSVAMR